MVQDKELTPWGESAYIKKLREEGKQFFLGVWRRGLPLIIKVNALTKEEASHMWRIRCQCFAGVFETLEEAQANLPDFYKLEEV
jgi:hypothetical protein